MFVRLGTLLLASALLGSEALAREFVEGEIIVKLRDSASKTDKYQFLGKASGEKSMMLKNAFSRINLFHFSLRKGQKVDDAVAELAADPSVLYAEPNYIVRKSDSTGLQESFSADEVHAAAAASPSSNQATGAKIGAQTVWADQAATPARPIVAVIDTGMKIDHPVFVSTGAVFSNDAEAAGRGGADDDNNGYVDDVNGWNFVDDSPNMYDDDGHGTHVAGIILSLDQNIFASSLRQSKIRIMPLKFLDGNGSGSTSNAIRAIYYAANNGASVINASWGSDAYSSALQDAIAYAYGKGILFVAAAGNASANNDVTSMYPANYAIPNLVSVAATNDSDVLAPFSNFGGSSVHLASPGVYILSTYNDNKFATMSGTSMATPFVAGTAIQIKAMSPNMLAYQMREILLSRFNTVNGLVNKVTTSGRLAAGDSVTFAKTAAVETTQPTYVPTYQAERGLASSIAGGGGCGMVKAINGADGEPPFGSAGAVIVLLLAPVMVLAAMRARSPQSRRRYDRFKIQSDVRIQVGDQEMVGSISSISLGGVQVNTNALLQDGGLVTMSIASPDGQERVEVAGRVVWSAANSAYGVAFDKAPQSVLSRVSDWTRGLQKAA